MRKLPKQPKEINFEENYAFSGSQRDKDRKLLFIKEFARTYHIAQSCKAVPMQRSTYYSYLQHDPEFKRAVDEVEEEIIDNAEKALLGAVQLMDSQSLKFFLSRKAKKRGYGDEDVNLKHSGNLVIKWADEDENE